MEKALYSIEVEDLQASSIWRFIPSRDGKQWLKSLRLKRTKLTGNHVVACELLTPSRSKLWGLIEGLDPENPLFSFHWRKLYIFLRPGSWYELARYHDFDYSTHGPGGLAKALGRKTEEIFPLTFDVSHLSILASEVFSGTFEANPKNQLTRREIIGLVVKKIPSSAGKS